MKCERCETEADLHTVWCPDSRRPLTMLCLICWGDLQIWMKQPPKNLMLALHCWESAILTEHEKDLLLEGQGGEVDFVRPMGVSDDC